jgi:hypothetical protein
MERIVCVSTNNNPDYYFYSPYIAKAWRSYGWKVACVITHDVNPNYIDADYIIQMEEMEGLKTGTIAQGGRLYAANILPNDSLIMTSDMDLLPLADYWKPDVQNMTVFGHDLTWRSFYPMGYIAMSCAKWKEIMQLTSNTKADFERDAKSGLSRFTPYSDKWEEYWDWDWDFITNRMKPFEKEIIFIDRGQVNVANNTLALGRVDRFNWEKTLAHCETTCFIDAHCENNNVKHPVKLEPFLKLFERFYGKL